MKRKAVVILLAVVFVLSIAVLAACNGSKYFARFETNGAKEDIPYQETDVVYSVVRPTKDGFVFGGWYLKRDFSDENGSVTFPYRLTEDTTFYAKWIPNGGGENTGSYTATFEGNGGTSPAAQTGVAYATEPAKPIRGEYLFTGWYLNQITSGSPVDFPYQLSGDTTFYAGWKLIEDEKYTVTFESNGGTFVQSQTVQAGESVTLPANMEKQGAVFEGWYTSPTFNVGKVTGTTYTPTEDIILYAKWTVTAQPNPTDSAELQGYLSATTSDNFGASYDLKVDTTEGTKYRAVSSYSFAENFVYRRAPYWTGDSWVLDTNGNYYYFTDWGFYRPSEASWQLYLEAASGVYTYGALRYETEPTEDIEETFDMIYLAKIATLDASKFYKYEGKWYAIDDYAPQAGELILGNCGEGDLKSAYSSFALVFDKDGVITGIEATSLITEYTQIGSGTGVTYYFYTHKIGIKEIGNIVAITEDEFIQDQERPNGYYPKLNENDPKRNNANGDGKTYTVEQLQTALQQLVNFTAYYTFAGNTFDGYIYNPVTIYNQGGKGKVVTEAYIYEIESGTTVKQSAGKDQYYYYNEDNGAFFRLINNNNGGYYVYCDQCNFENTYEYNQYLLGVGASGSAITFNCKLPTANLKDISADKFVFNAKLGCFEFAGAAEEMKTLGQMLFGNNDLTYPELDETEGYAFIRIFMKDGAVQKVVAASQLVLSGESNEMFMKEIVITSYTTDEVTLPVNADTLYAPGEAKENGNVEKLEQAFAAMGSNYTYTDTFTTNNGDELWNVTDVYKYTQNASTAGSLTNATTMFYKDGKLYLKGSSGDVEVNYEWTKQYLTVNKGQWGIITVTDDYVAYEMNNWAKWATPIAQMFDASWFYEGKDGKYYGKPECMEQIAEVIARYSGTYHYLDHPAFGGAYNRYVVLKFVSVELSAGKVANIYYGGRVHTKSFGEFDMDFSGRGEFTSVNATTISGVPSGADSARPAKPVYTLMPPQNVAVSDDGILTFDPVDNADSYTVKVYNAQDVLVKSAPATNGMDLHAVEGLLAEGVVINRYFVCVTAQSADEYLNESPQSAKVYTELSRL
ncbi:MAG: InlB B-repeat-containing protein, partial [Corallococcus sp.]|nr:InlB B-repeat-containing protein [Corallococcus sp.]